MDTIEGLSPEGPKRETELAGGHRRVSSLQAPETFFHSLVDESPYPMWISDDQGTLIKLNRACMNLLDVTEEEVVGRYNILADNIVEDQGLMPLVRQVFEAGETVRFTIRYDSSRLTHLQLTNHACVILDVTIFAIRDGNGRITNTVIQHVDITERERAEEELRRHRDQLEEIVRERTAELEKRYAQLVDEVGRRERAEAALRQANDLLEMRIEERTVELERANRALQDEVVERKETEERVRNVALFPEENPSPVLRVSGDGVLLYANRAAAGLVDHWGCRVGEPVPSPVQHEVMSALESGKRRNADIQFNERILSAVLAAVPERGYVNLYCTDVTERKEVEDALRKSEEMARQRLLEIEDLYHYAPVGLCMLDMELRWVRINERLAEMNGFPVSEHVGKRVDELLPLLAAKVMPLMYQVLETGEPLHGVEVTGETPARPGVERSWTESWLPFRDSMGRIIGLNIVVEETTERGIAEEELRRHRDNLDALVKERTAEIEIKNTQLMVEVGERTRAEAALHGYARRLIELEEDMRKRLAAELHDELGRDLTALGLNLAIISNDLSPESKEKLAERIEDTAALVEELSQNVRQIMFMLRPPVLDDYGLAAALRWHTDLFTKRTGIHIGLHAEDYVVRLAEPAELALFRIAHEALTNISKHAGAKSVTIRLESEASGAKLAIIDDGRGFAHLQMVRIHDAGWGLTIMRERAEAVGGNFRICSKPGNGTTVSVEIMEGPGCR